MVNFKELLGNDNQLQNLLLDTVEEGEVYRLCLTKEEGIIPKNKGDEGRKKFFVVVGKDQEGNAIGFVLVNSEINKYDLVEIKKAICSYENVSMKLLKRFGLIYCWLICI